MSHCSSLPLALADFPGASLLISLAWIAGVIFFLKYLLNVYSLFALRQLDHTENAVTEADLHPEVRRHLQPWLDRLVELGFSSSGISQIQHLSNWERYLWRLSHADTGSIAELRILIPPTGAAPRATLNLYNFLSDGRLLATNRPGSEEQVPAHWLRLTKNFKTVGYYWETHLARLAALAPTVTSILPTDVRAAMVAELIAVDRAACAAGVLERDPADPSLLRVRRLAIPFLSFKMLKYSLPGQGMMTRLEDLAAPTDPMPIAENPTVLEKDSRALVEQDIERYQQLASQKRGMGKLAKLVLLALSIGLFALVWNGASLGEDIGIIIGVLLLHEFGHWLPMKLFGYQNVTMFFIPGFGAAVTGEKHAVPAWQEFIVLLGGPLPGLVAGISVIVLGYFHPEIPDLLLSVAEISVLLNAFNLLPFLPLDGGRILDLLIFKDLSRLRLFFNGFSTLLAVGLCFIPGSGGFIVLAVVMVMGCYGQLKMLPVIRMAKKLGGAGKITTEEAALRQYFTDLRDAGNSTYVGSPDWLAKTKTVIEEAVRKPPSWWERTSGLVVYGATCLAPLLLFGALAWYLMKPSDVQSGRSAWSDNLRQQLPKNTVMLGTTDRAPILKLARDTEARLEDEEANDAHALPTSQSAVSMLELDQLNWDHIGISQREGTLSSSTVGIWLEAACKSTENASNEGNNVEAVRRLEIMLNAIHSLEPASTYSQRLQLGEVQVRTLQTFGKLNGTGAITPELQKRLKQSLQLLDDLPIPTREAILLVEGWSRLEPSLRLSGTFEEPSATADEDDVNLCRELYRMLEKPNRGVAVEATAMRWVHQGKVDGLPDDPPSEKPVKLGEAIFLRQDRDQRQEIIWLQETLLHVMSLDATQKQKGQLPQKWDHLLAGGGRLDLVSTPKPLIRLTDARSEAQRSGPAWLGKSFTEPRAAIDFPLRPVP